MENLAFLISAILILFAVWNGFVINWKRAACEVAYTRDSARLKIQDNYSNIWHCIGFFTRAIVVLLFFITYGFENDSIIYALAFINLSWTGYDIIINLVMKLHKPQTRIFYIDNKGFNAFFIKIFTVKGVWMLRFLLILGNIIFFYL